MIKLIVFLLGLSLATTCAARPSLFLIGGQLQTCASNAPEACNNGSFPVGANQLARRYRIDRAGIDRLQTGWHGQRDEIRDAVTAALSEGTAEVAGDVDQLGLRGVIGPVWERLATFERERIFDALELAPENERSQLAATVSPHSLAIVNSFTSMAREVSMRGRPRILVVTASSRDPFASIDFYTELFAQTDAKVLWLPMDAALRKAQANPGTDCERLDELRADLGAAHDRARLYPANASQLQSACLNPTILSDLLLWTDSVFFNGGDQSFTRAAWFNTDGTPSAELILLRQRHSAGQIMIGGTSAGAAVQAYSKAMMVSGQDQIGHAKATTALPPLLGCTAAGVCHEDEFSLLYHPGGGLNTFDLGVVDTHFSERGREWRLARLLIDADLQLGLGIDETTAVRLDRTESGFDARVIGAGSVSVMQLRTSDVVIHRYADGASFALPNEANDIRCKGKALAQKSAAVDSFELRKALDAASKSLRPTPIQIGGQAVGQACGRDGATVLKLD